MMNENKEKDDLINENNFGNPTGENTNKIDEISEVVDAKISEATENAEEIISETIIEETETVDEVVSETVVEITESVEEIISEPVTEIKETIEEVVKEPVVEVAKTERVENSQPYNNLHAQLLNDGANQTNKMGQLGLILSIAAIIVSFIPFLNFISWIVWILGLVFSIIGLTRKPKGMAITGLVISLLGVILMLFLAAFIVAALATAT